MQINSKYVNEGHKSTWEMKQILQIKSDWCKFYDAFPKEILPLNEIMNLVKL